MATQFVENKQLNRGDDWVLPVRIIYGGAAADISTGYNFRFTLKKTSEEADADATFEADNQGGTNLDIIDGPNGRVRVTIPKATTEAMLPGFYVGDLQMTTPDDITITPYKVIIENVADITITEP